jgi:hypothetical protein
LETKLLSARVPRASPGRFFDREDAGEEQTRTGASPTLTLDDTMPISIENAVGQKLLWGRLPFRGQLPVELPEA